MITENIWILLYIALPIIAFLYASVGHGGASSYLMILALLGLAPEQIRPTALLMNIAVSFLAFYQFRKTVKVPTKLAVQLLIFSVPAAFLGGTILIESTLYKNLLGVILIFPIFKFLNLFPQNRTPIIERSAYLPAILGLTIGFFSGLIGIGGGIILSPVLLLLGWTNIKETAAISALFIFINSIAGFIGANGFQTDISPELWTLMPITIIAGALGAYFGAQRFNGFIIKGLLITVLTFASIKLILS